MPHRFDVVAVGIEHERGAIVLAAGLQRGGMERVDRGARFGTEGDR